MYKKVVFKGVSKCFTQGWSLREKLWKGKNDKFDKIRFDEKINGLGFEIEEKFDKFGKIKNLENGLNGVKKVLKMIRGNSEYRKVNLNAIFANCGLSAVVCKVREIEEVDLEMIEVVEEDGGQEEKLEFFKYGKEKVHEDSGGRGGLGLGLGLEVEVPVVVGIKGVLDLIEVDEVEYKGDLGYGGLNVFRKYDQEKINMIVYKDRRVFDFSSSAPPFISSIKDIRLTTKNLQKQNIKDSLQLKSQTLNMEPKIPTKDLSKSSTVAKSFQNLKSESLISSNLILQNKNDSLKKNLPFQDIGNSKKIKPVIPCKPPSKSILKPVQSEDELSEPEQSQPQPDFSDYKLTFISSLDSLKKPSRLIQFSDTTQHSAYSKPDFKSEPSKILIKIYLDCNCPLASKLVSLLNMEKFNIIGLEIPSEYMDSVDMIINLQTAVKFIFNWRVKEFADIKGFLHTFHRKLLNFESVLLVYVFKDKEFDEIVEITLKDYSDYMKQFDLSLVVISTCHARPVLDCLNQYFEDYIGSIRDLELWNRLQEEISDIVPKFKDSGMNVYAVNVVQACKARRDLVLVDIVNNLGLGSREKFCKMVELLKI